MKRVEQFIKHPRKALFILAGPIVVAMVVQIMYNIVDTAYVGRLGAESVAALTFSFPLFFILIALNSGLAAGMGSRISRFLGEKNIKQAENTAMHALFISIILAFLIFIFGKIVLRPLFVLFGATPSVTVLAVQYMSIILIGAFFWVPAYVLTNILASQGDTKTPMKIQISALILNAALDPIFIFALGLGIKGAALATVCGFGLALILGLYFIRTKSQLHIHIDSFRFSPKILKDIFKVGFPATLMMLMLSFYIIFLNRFMSYYGVNHVAAFGLASRAESVAMMPIVGFSLATLTLVGMFLGAKEYELVRLISWFSLRISVSIAAFFAFFFFIFPTLLLRIFTPSTILIALGSDYLRISVFTFPLMAVTFIVSRILQGMGKGLPGLIINLIRIFFVAIPLAYLFVFIMHLGYLWIAVALIVGGIAGNIVAFSWLNLVLKRLGHRKNF